VVYRKPAPVSPARDRRPVVRMPDPPEERDEAAKQEYVALLRTEGRASPSRSTRRRRFWVRCALRVWR
jgi:hypothetical protein